MSPSSALPAALLAQFPALAGIQWDALPPDDFDGGVGGGGDISGRSSFDASSGGEWIEEDEDIGGADDDFGGSFGTAQQVRVGMM